ncbi:hypothetical protein CVT24_005653 [Panaeolus cyanescens]|uniref:Cytochrome P450 n=1 Tax=Panaeolus cyanescens TaxID=181874 RepID=A0A409V9K0_9AGAR|nr:hypothetical protein CVT24_005653 [Panaeolus cyanescens]
MLSSNFVLDGLSWQNTTIYAFGTAAVALLISYFASEGYKLSHIPTVGSPLPFLSFFSAFKFMFRAKSMIISGVKHHKTLCKVPEFDQWVVVAGDRELMDDIRKAPEHVLSAMTHLDELLQGPYTFGTSTILTTYHLPLLRGTFTKSIPHLFPEVLSEVRDSFFDVIPPSQEWKALHLQSSIMHIIARVSNLTFVGRPLCQNKEFIDLSVRFTQDALKAAIILRPLPSIIKPIVNYFISNISETRKKVKDLLTPHINLRREAMKGGSEYAGKQMDLLTWLLDEAKGEDATDDALTSMLLFTNFGAIHAPAMALAHSIFYLAANPKYVELLRDEVAGITSRLGWTKDAIDEMVITDSFIKESQRLHAGAYIALIRKALRDFTFSNGVTIPKGTTVSGSAVSNHLDEKLYPDPHTFDPLRFVKMASESTKKFDITAVGLDLIVFGYGRHACPGRFFAAVEMKLILAYLVTHYDMKFAKEGVRPSDLTVGINVLPNPFAEVLFRKRV